MAVSDRGPGGPRGLRGLLGPFIAAAVTLGPFAVWLAVPHWFIRHVGIPLGIVAYVIYLLVLLAVWFATQVGRDYLRAEAADLAVLLREIRQRLTSGYERRYRDHLRNLHHDMDSTGLPPAGPSATALDEVYVDVSLFRRSPQQIRDGLVPVPPVPPDQGQGDQPRWRPSPTQRRSIWDFLVRDGSPRARLAIIGAPGSGKTTLLMHIARWPYDIERPAPRRYQQMRLPVLLPLKECATAITEDLTQDLPTVITSQVRSLAGEPPPRWFERQLTAGRCVVMLDGLDEVTGEQDRLAIFDWLNKQIARYAANEYVLTSRLESYPEKELLQGTSLQMREFTPAQISKFVHRWYRAAEQHPIDERPIGNAAAEAESLILTITRTKGLPELAANPLLLYMMARVHLYTGKLPDSRVDLYKQMCSVVLARRQLAVADRGEPLPPEKKEAVLRQLAFRMMAGGEGTFTADRAAAVIGRQLARVAPDLGPAKFLAHVRATGLLIEPEPGSYDFAHSTFREYLTAVHITKTGQVGRLVRNITNPSWRETTVFYAALANAKAIVEACLASGELSALALAFDCAEEDRKLDPALQRRLGELLSDAADPAAPPERRTLAAAVIATRELQQTVQLTGGLQTCVVPVSQRLYDLFSYHSHAQYPAPGQAAGQSRADERKTAIGMPAADAIAFVEWLNVILGKDEYRLPTRTQAEDHGFPDNQAIRGHCIWLAPVNGSGEPDLWIPPEVNNPFAVTRQQLRERATLDATGPIGESLAAMLAFALTHTLSAADTLAFGPHLHPSPRVVAQAEHLRDMRTRVHTLSVELIERLAPDRTSGLHLLLASALGHASSRALGHDFAFKLATEFTADSGPAPGRARAFELAFDQARARALNLSMALRVAMDDVFGRSFQYGITPGRSIDPADPRTRAFNSALDDDLEIALHADLDLDLPVCMVYERNAPAPGDRQQVIDLIWGSELGAIVARRPERAVLPDVMRRLARDGLLEFECMAPGSSLDHLRVRAAAVASRINDRILALDDDENAVTADLASYVRLGSLVVAASIGHLGADPEVAQGYVDIAAGITALQNRATGSVPPNEVLVLVRA
jgi:NACHT domain